MGVQRGQERRLTAVALVEGQPVQGQAVGQAAVQVSRAIRHFGR